MIIERKTWKDLADTIKDPQRRANHKKLLNLRNECQCSIIYIIEGTPFPSPDRKFARVPCKNLRAYLDHIMIRDGCHIVHTQSSEDTAIRIIELCTNCMTIKGDGDAEHISADNNTSIDNLSDGDVKDQVMSYILSSLQNQTDSGLLTPKQSNWEADIGAQLIDKVGVSVGGGPFKELTVEPSEADMSAVVDYIVHTDMLTKRVATPSDATHEQIWQCIHGITCISYPIVSALYTLEQIVNDGCPDPDMGKRISELKYPSGGSFGIKRASQILNSAKSKATHEKMMVCINGITKTSAIKILQQTTMLELLKMDKKEISSLVKSTKIVKGENRNLLIGDALSQKIYDILHIDIV